MLIDEKHATVSSGDYTWKSSFENGVWTYPLEEAWKGLNAAISGVQGLEDVAAVGVSGMLLRLIATFLFVIAIVCRIFSVADWGQSGALIVVSFIVFTLPTIADGLTSFVESVNSRLWRFIRR